MNSRGAFTLMEVLIAVMIISLLVTSALKIVSGDNTLIRHVHHVEFLSDTVSLISNNLKVQKDKKSIDVYDNIKNYKIKDSDKKFFKNEIEYSSKLIKTFDENESDDDLQNSKNSKGIIFSIYKENFRNREGYSVSFFRVFRE